MWSRRSIVLMPLITAFKASGVCVRPTAPLGSRFCQELVSAVSPDSKREDANVDFARRVFDGINAIREHNGAEALRWSDAVADCARAQSRRKVELRFAGHVDPERGGVDERLNAAGVNWSQCGENLFMERGWDDPVNYAFVFWWYSHGHQANLLNSEFTETGVGVDQAEDGTWYVTQIFITPRQISRNNTKRFR